MNSAPSYDALIVGARAAGASTAMLLARRGLRVVVVDREGPGADTLSTHALMRGGVLQLSRWGLLPRLLAGGTPAIRRTVFHYADGVVDVPIKPRDGVPALFAPRRTLLDRVLVEAAREAGADVRHRTTVEDLLLEPGGRVVGARVRDVRGRVESVRARLVVGADGLRSTVAERVAAPVTRAGRHATATVYGYWSGLNVDGYHWYWGTGASGGDVVPPGALGASPAAARAGAAGAIPTNGGLVLVFASVPAADFARVFRPDVLKGYRGVLELVAPDLALRLREARLEGPIRGFPGRPGHIRRSAGPGWALVGDAAYFKDPLTAHGITDALRDAELLADAAASSSADPGERHSSNAAAAVVAAAALPEVEASVDAPHPAAEREPLAGYERERDALSTRLFDVTDRIASFAWSTAELRTLHRALSEEMKLEVEALERRAASRPTSTAGLASGPPAAHEGTGFAAALSGARL